MRQNIALSLAGYAGQEETGKLKRRTASMITKSTPTMHLRMHPSFIPEPVTGDTKTLRAVCMCARACVSIDLPKG